MPCVCARDVDLLSAHARGPREREPPFPTGHGLWGASCREHGLWLVGYGDAEAAALSLARPVNYDLGVLDGCPIFLASSDTTLLLPHRRASKERRGERTAKLALD